MHSYRSNNSIGAKYSISTWLLSAIITACICFLLLNELIPALMISNYYNTFWKSIITISFFSALLLLFTQNIYFFTENKIFFIIIFLLAVLGTISTIINSSSFHWGALIPIFICFSSYSLGRNGSVDAGALASLLVLILGFAAAFLPILLLKSLQVQRAISISGAAYLIPKQFELGTQWYGLSGSPNVNGFLAFYGLFYFIPNLIRKINFRVILFFFFITCLFLSASRGSFIALISGAFYFFIKAKISFSRGVLFFIFMLVLTFFISLFLNQNLSLYYDRFTASHISYDIETRLIIFSSALNIIFNNFAFGCGTNEYSLVGPSMSLKALGAHVWYMELGVVYGALYAMLVMFLCIYLFFLINRHANNNLFYAKFGAILIATIIYGFSNGLMSHNIQWVFIGYSYGLMSQLKSDFLLHPKR